MKSFIFALCLFFAGIAGAGEVPHEFIRIAESRYAQGDYDGAARYLLAVPGVARLAPKLTPMEQDARARLFFDLGCCYLASGDSSRADLAFKEAFALNDRLNQGYFEQADPGTFWWALLRNKEAARRLKTRRITAFMRSFFVPGWGQFYRGHKAKGYGFIGATLVTSGIMGLQYRSFKNARRYYEEFDVLTRRFYSEKSYGNEDGTRYTEWEARHRAVKSRAKRVNIMVGILGAIWVLNMADSAVFGPAPMGLTVQF